MSSPILRVDGSKLEELGKVVECRESQHGQNVTHQSALIFSFTNITIRLKYDEKEINRISYANMDKCS